MQTQKVRSEYNHGESANAAVDDSGDANGDVGDSDDLCGSNN
jgi:hypothetical protein